MGEVSLRIGSEIWEGWDEAEVTLSIERVFGSYSLSLFAIGQDTPPAIRPQSHAAVLVDGETVITGPIDSTSPSYEEEAVGISVAGRDRSAQLVDCAALNEPGEWRGVRAATIVEALAAPFEVKVAVDVEAVETFKRFKLEPGETAFKAIERVCAHRALLPVADGRGGLLLTRAGTGPRAATRLRPGENVIKASGKFDETRRFSTYIVRGQSEGIDFNDVGAHTGAEGRALDKGMSLYRPTVIMAPEPGVAGDFQTLADTAASIGLGRSRRATYTVAGWRDGGGNLWRPNTTVSIEDDKLGIRGDHIVVDVTFRIGKDKAEETELTIARAGAFALVPVPEDKGLFG